MIVISLSWFYNCINSFPRFLTPLTVTRLFLVNHTKLHIKLMTTVELPQTVHHHEGHRERCRCLKQHYCNQNIHGFICKSNLYSWPGGEITFCDTIVHVFGLNCEKKPVLLLHPVLCIWKSFVKLLTTTEQSVAEML